MMNNDSMEDIFQELSLDAIVQSLDDPFAPLPHFPAPGVESSGLPPLMDLDFESHRQDPLAITPPQMQPLAPASAVPMDMAVAAPSNKDIDSFKARRKAGARRGVSDPEALRRFASLNEPQSAQPSLDSFVAELDSSLFGGMGMDLYPASIPPSAPPAPIVEAPVAMPPAAPAVVAPIDVSTPDTPKKRKRNTRHRRAVSDPSALASAAVALQSEQESIGGGVDSAAATTYTSSGRPRRASASSTAKAAATDSKNKSQSSRGRYKCGRCGQVKQGHTCILTTPDTRVSIGSQVDLCMTTQGPQGQQYPVYKTISVSNRTSISEPTPMSM